MKKLKLLINSKTSGKFHREMIDGRSHIVTQMMPVRGDTAMNNIFYPDSDIESSFMQLNMLPAPSGHPVVNGVNVLASHPVANNKQNIGGYLRNPRKKGKRVFVDFMLDEKIANNSEDGVETIRRIENGEKIGVSTGLGIQRVINKSGRDDFGIGYTREGSGFTFDHVAILLNETAAGEHAGTELITNSEECEVMRYNAEASVYDDVSELLAHDERYEVSINNGIIAVNHQLTTNEVGSMNKTEIVLAIVKNSANKYEAKDIDALTDMTDAELASIVATNTLDVDLAKEYLKTNAAIDFDSYEEFHANKDEYQAFKAAKVEAQKAVIDNIVANSEYTAELLSGKSDAELALITNMIAPKKAAVRIGEQAPTQTTNATKKEVVVDFS
jgi:hypothetical protein